MKSRDHSWLDKSPKTYIQHTFSRLPDTAFYDLLYAYDASILETLESMRLRRVDLLGPVFYIVALKLSVVSYSFLSIMFVCFC